MMQNAQQIQQRIFENWDGEDFQDDQCDKICAEAISETVLNISTVCNFLCCFLDALASLRAMIEIG